MAELQERYGDDAYGDTLARHLSANRGEGLELSEYRFTRVVKLYDQTRHLDGESRYARFFAENMDMFSVLERRVDAFLRRSAGVLTRAARLREVETPATYEELMHERREDFAKECREVFGELALFLSRALLRSETSEAHIVERLRSIGFAAAQPMNKPEFPIHSLTLLGIALFLYLSGFSFVLHHGQAGNDLMMKIAVVTVSRLAAIGSVLLLIQRYVFFQRLPGEAHRYFAYLVCGILGAAAAALIYYPLLYAWVQSDPVHNMVPSIMITGIICAVLAFCCNDWVADERPPRWLPLAEAAVCATVVTVAMALMVAADWMDLNKTSNGDYSLKVVIVAGVNLMAVMIGSYVPHIYRAAHRAAAARAAPLCAEVVGPVPTATAGQGSRAEIGGTYARAANEVVFQPPAPVRAVTFGNVRAPAGVFQNAADASRS